MDNWITSVSLAEKLLKDEYKLTNIREYYIRKNKREIPQELLNVKNRVRNTCMFCFDKRKTLVSYMPKKNKVVLLLSLILKGADVSKINGKPTILADYNGTIGGVDIFGQMCSNINKDVHLCASSLT
ncbi:uncharacterized protein [Diabrotica undecimpunctata]|uniref:uncharacterized protein n=1 Tax=Diabrotica undecimpunctata TaxID=50387 RepID=UPI003B640925